MSRFATDRELPSEQIPLLPPAAPTTGYQSTALDESKPMAQLVSLRQLLREELSQQSRCYRRLSKKHRYYLFFLLSFSAFGMGGFFFLRALVQKSKHVVRDWNSILTGPGSTINCAKAYNSIARCRFVASDNDGIEIVGLSVEDSPICYSAFYDLCKWSCSDKVITFPKDCTSLSFETQLFLGIFFAVLAIAAAYWLSQITMSNSRDNQERTFDFFNDRRHLRLMEEAKVIKAPSDGLNDVLQKIDAAIAQLR